MYRWGATIAALLVSATAYAEGPVQAEAPVQAELPDTDALVLEDDNTAAGPNPTPLAMMRWLDPNADQIARVTTRPADDIARGQSAMIELGRVAFRSPALFGGYAAEVGLSCNACHPAGRAEAQFSLPPLSPRAGQVDVSHGLFSTLGDDLRDNPRPITDLTQAARPFGTVAPMDDLPAYIEKVITTDFAGPTPDPLILSGLAAYVMALKQSPPRLPSPYADEAPDKQYARYLIDAVNRAVAIGQRTISEEQQGPSLFVLTALRAEIGLIHERLDPEDPARDLLAAHAVALRSVDEFILSLDWFNAARTLRTTHRALSEDLTPILSRADLTYFNQVWLAGAIDPSLREPLEDDETADQAQATKSEDQ